MSEESSELYKKNNICANKQNAARSVVEQAADLTKTFKIMLSLQKTVSVTSIPRSNHPLKHALTNAIKHLAELNLKHCKKNAIIDFISSIPGMTMQAATRKNILQDFFETE